MTNCCSYLPQKRLKLLLVERIVLDLICEESMALADGCTYRLSRLLPSPILDNYILVRSRPCLTLVPSGFEDALIGEDEVAALLNDLVNFVPKLDSLLSVFTIELILLLRLILGLHPLIFKAIELENLTIVLGLEYTVWKLAMKEPSSFSKT